MTEENENYGSLFINSKRLHMKCESILPLHTNTKNKMGKVITVHHCVKTCVFVCGAMVRLSMIQWDTFVSSPLYQHKHQHNRRKLLFYA